MECKVVDVIGTQSTKGTKATDTLVVILLDSDEDGKFEDGGRMTAKHDMPVFGLKRVSGLMSKQ